MDIGRIGDLIVVIIAEIAVFLGIQRELMGGMAKGRFRIKILIEKREPIGIGRLNQIKILPIGDAIFIGSKGIGDLISSIDKINGGNIIFTNSRVGILNFVYKKRF